MDPFITLRFLRPERYILDRIEFGKQAHGTFHEIYILNGWGGTQKVGFFEK